MKLNARRLALFLLLINLDILMPSKASLVDSEERGGVYIVHMDVEAMPAMFSGHEAWYKSMLSSAAAKAATESVGISPQSRHLYTYSNVMHGFSAVLSEAELKHLRTHPAHIDAYPSSKVKLLTTHSHKFLGLNRHSGLWPASNYGDDVIIGFFDTGVWPESRSFDDKGIPPVPARWKGACESGTRFNSSDCNRKLIGARSFGKVQKHFGLNFTSHHDYDSPRDHFGHGTHTSSTAAGSHVPGVDCFGYAKGNAIGVAPRARIAMYKVDFDFDGEGYDADLLAAMDQAMEDGIDIMSLSITVGRLPFYMNAIAIGAFAAMEKGILVSCSAGNRGPLPYTLINDAPWITTVGAATMDRAYTASVTLGEEDDIDSITIQGNSAYPENLFVSGIELYYGGDDYNKSRCKPDSLQPTEVNGKIVLCTLDTSKLPADQMEAVAKSGALAAIIASDRPFAIPILHFATPAVIVTLQDEKIVREYLNLATKKMNPRTAVSITFQQTIIGATITAPQVANFSSRGPSKFSHGILKPDIIGPGVDILAGWARAPDSSMVKIRGNPVISDYLLISGTSMSAPHIAGVAALLKAAHPDWSPTAIRSAIMTTASFKDNIGGVILDQNKTLPATPLDFGAGHVNPNKALDPGLVYDLGAQDYIDYLCGLGYNSSQIKMVTRRSYYTCNPQLDLNYPTFFVTLQNNSSYSTSQSFRRVLTSVTDEPSTYRAKLSLPEDMTATVSPQTLMFEGKHSTKEFTMNVDVHQHPNGGVNYGFLTWEEVGGKCKVASAIVSASA